MKIISNSWGFDSTSYDSSCQYTDQFVYLLKRRMNDSYSHDDCVIIFAGGNDGENGSYL